MQQLKKIAAIGGAILMVACWPLAVGQIAQNVLTDGVKTLNTDDFSAEVMSYKRGYLSAHAETKYSIINPEIKKQLILDGLPTEFTLSHDIKHGLMRIATESTFVDFSNNSIVLNTITQLNGNSEFKLDSEAMSYQVPNSENSAVYINKSKIEGSVTVLGQVDFIYDFPSIQFKFENSENITLSNISGSVSGKQVNQFWQGKQNIIIENISMMTSAGDSIASGKNLSYQFSSTTNDTGDRINTNHLVKANDLATQNGVLDDLNVDITLGNLDTQSFGGLVNIYQSNPVITEQVLREFAPKIDDLFDKGFFVEMNGLQLKLGKGVFDSKWRLEVPEGTENVSQDVSKVVPALQGKLNTFISNGLVEMYPFIQEGIDELIIMEIMTEELDGYKIDAQISAGNLNFENGHKIPLLAVLMTLMMR